MGRLMGIDYGDKRIGIALSDELKIIASPYKVIINNGDNIFDEILREIKENNVEALIVGMPLSMSGGDTKQTIKVREFVDKLKKVIDIGIFIIDERLTTAEAMRTMHFKGEKIRHNKHKVDMISASLILQTYLDSRDKVGGYPKHSNDSEEDF